MDLRKLKTLIDLVSESGIAELEITEGEGKVRIVKFSQAHQPVAYASPVAAPSYAPAAPAAGVSGNAAPEVAPVAAGHTVKAPMGTKLLFGLPCSLRKRFKACPAQSCSI